MTAGSGGIAVTAAVTVAIIIAAPRCNGD